MATTDSTTVDSPCPCGEGVIAVTRSEPDHGYMRAKQVDYSAKIACESCADRYEIRQGAHDAYPWVVRRSDADRQQQAAEMRAALEMEAMASDATARLRGRVVAEVDGQPSMAAAHRVLKRFGLARETISSYRRRPYGGAFALRDVPTVVLMRIGSLAEMGEADTPAFKRWADDLDGLEDDVLKLEPAPVKTGGTWLRV